MVGPVFCVVTVPIKLLFAAGLVKVLVPAKLKQYIVPTVKSVLGKVTFCPETLVAVPMPGQAVAPKGRLVIVVVQLAAVELTPKPVGKVTITIVSTSVVVGLAQTVPPVVAVADIRSRRTAACVSPAACTF